MFWWFIFFFLMYEVCSRSHRCSSKVTICVGYDNNYEQDTSIHSLSVTTLLNSLVLFINQQTFVKRFAWNVCILQLVGCYQIYLHSDIKEIVHPIMKIWLTFTHPHVVGNLYNFMTFIMQFFSLWPMLFWIPLIFILWTKTIESCFFVCSMEDIWDNMTVSNWSQKFYFSGIGWSKVFKTFWRQMYSMLLHI